MNLKTLTLQIFSVGVLVLIQGILGPANAHTGANCGTGSTLTKDDRFRTAFAFANGQEFISALVLVPEASTVELAEKLHENGARIRFADRELGLISIVLPVDFVLGLSSWPEIDALHIEQPSSSYGRYAGRVEFLNVDYRLKMFSENRSFEAPSSNLGAEESANPLFDPLSDPFDIRRDLNAIQFVGPDEEIDGRGVVIGQVENLADVLLPELQVGRDAAGHAVSKFLDVRGWPEDRYDSESGEVFESSSNWIHLSDIKHVEGAVSIVDKEYLGLPDGDYRTGVFEFSYSQLPSFIGSFQHRLNGPEKEFVSVSVAINASSQMIYADMNDDGVFEDTEVYRPYRIGRAFGVWGSDDPSTSIRETIGFAFELRGTELGLHLGVGGHATMVAGAMAANAASGGLINGVSPGAQLISFDAGRSASNFARALISAFEDERVDIVQIQGNSGVTFYHDRKDGCSLFARLLDRLQQTYPKPAFFTAFNRAGISTGADAGNSDGVISAGAYQSSVAVKANRLIRLQKSDNLHWNGAEGPNGRGDTNPDLLAPANPISLEPGFRRRSPIGYRGVFDLPPGYGIAAGTSTAAPVAAGAAALLVDAARRDDVCWDTASFYRALKGGARFLESIGAYQQGAGLLDVGASWHELNAAGCLPRSSIQVRAPVQTLHSNYGATESTGSGLFVREDVQIGGKYEWSIQLNTLDPDLFGKWIDLDVLGDADSDFELPSSVRLSESGDAQVTIKFVSDTVGVKSAYTVIKRSDTGEDAGRFLMTVIVPRELSQESLTVSESVSLDAPYRDNFHMRVPVGMSLLELEVDAPVSRSWFTSFVRGPDNGQGQREFRLFADGNGSSFVSIPNPEPGVWEIALHDSGEIAEFDWRTFPGFELRPIDVDVSVRAHRSNAASSIGTKTELFQGRRTTTTHAIDRDQITSIPLMTDGTYLKQIEFSGSIDHYGDVDLFLFKCVEDQCVPAASSTTYGSDESIQLYAPEDGVWKLVVVVDSDREAEREAPALSVSSFDLNRNADAAIEAFKAVFACAVSDIEDQRWVRQCDSDRELTRPRLIEIRSVN